MDGPPTSSGAVAYSSLPSRNAPLASALGGLTNDGTVLVVARFIKGVGAAFTVPAGLSILTTTFAEGAARNKALGAYAATAAAGFKTPHKQGTPV